MRRLSLLFIVLCCAVIGRAAKAWNEPLTVRQSDGTYLTIFIHGDEHFSWRTTSDGVIIEQAGTDYFIGIIDKAGNLTASGQIAHDKENRSASEQALADKQDKRLFFQANAFAAREIMTRTQPIGESPLLFPHRGKPKAIVILAEFSDLKFTLPNPRKSFEQYLNSMDKHQNYGNDEHRNYGSVKKYFSDMSGGLFEPYFDIYGPITLPQTMAYYGKGKHDTGGHVYGVIEDACRLMDDSLDFSRYDSNADGIIDLVYVIYAGYGENMSANTNTLWPKSFTGANYKSKEGKKVGRCGISNELLGDAGKTPSPMINGIGLFCHEFSHCLGLPDFYPTNSTDTSVFPTPASFDNQGMENWSIMDNGCYTTAGYRPTAYTAWEREAMGWMTVDTLKTTQQVTLKSIDQEDGRAYRILNDNDKSGNDYYMIENIQNSGWNTGLKSHGMLVYHVNYDPVVFALSSNRVNNVKGKPRMTVVPADGVLLSSYRAGRPEEQGGVTKAQFQASLSADLFPGTGDVREIRDSMNFVNYAPWTGSKVLRKPITDIKEEEYTAGNGSKSRKITFNIKMLDKDEAITGITDRPEDVSGIAEDNRIYGIDGVFVGTSTDGLPKGVYIKNRKKFVIR